MSGEGVGQRALLTRLQHDPEAWVGMLRVAARFTRYSPSNVLLLWMRAELRGVTLSRVAGYRGLQAMGRHVVKARARSPFGRGYRNRRSAKNHLDGDVTAVGRNQTRRSTPEFSISPAHSREIFGLANSVG